MTQSSTHLVEAQLCTLLMSTIRARGNRGPLWSVSEIPNVKEIGRTFYFIFPSSCSCQVNKPFFFKVLLFDTFIYIIYSLCLDFTWPMDCSDHQRSLCCGASCSPLSDSCTLTFLRSPPSMPCTCFISVMSLWTHDYWGGKRTCIHVAPFKSTDSSKRFTVLVTFTHSVTHSHTGGKD